METNVNYTIVGAFVITLVAAIIFGIIWLSSGFSSPRTSIYQVEMQESVSGLSTDSAVEYNGVNVGSVKSMSINKDDPRLVDLYLNINADTPITKGTVAILTTRGITGLTYIALKDKGTNNQPLVANPGQNYPIIPTAPSIFLRLDTALNQLTKSFQHISDSVEALLTKENLKYVNQTLGHLEKITNALAGNGKQIDAIFVNAADASRQLSPLLQSGTDATNSLADFATELKQNPSVLIKGNPESGLGPGEVR